MLRKENLGVAFAIHASNWHTARHVTTDNTDCGAKRKHESFVCYTCNQLAFCATFQKIAQGVLQNENLKVACAIHVINWHAAKHVTKDNTDCAAKRKHGICVSYSCKQCSTTFYKR